MAYLKIPMMPIDNNACERGFKPLVKGRRHPYSFRISWAHGARQ